MMWKRLHLLPRRYRLLLVTVLVIAHAVPLIYASIFLFAHDARESIKFFPLHPENVFLSADSYLSVTDPNEHRYTIRLDSVSQTNHPAYLRQDIALLFQDGVLVKQSHNWERQVDTLLQRVEHQSMYNHLFQAVTFHHAEFHDSSATGGEQEIITSQQAMSSDYLYVAASRKGGTYHFHHPETPQENKWKEMVDRAVSQQLQFEWKQAMEEFEVDANQYYMIPLTLLPLYGDKEDLPGIAGDKQAAAIGGLWEGLYRYFVLGVTGEPGAPGMPSGSGKRITPEGSGIPLILIDKKGAHIRTLFRAADGRYHQLYQELSRL